MVGETELRPVHLAPHHVLHEGVAGVLRVGEEEQIIVGRIRRRPLRALRATEHRHAQGAGPISARAAARGAGAVGAVTGGTSGPPGLSTQDWKAVRNLHPHAMTTRRPVGWFVIYAQDTERNRIKLHPVE